jgi:hypothetical protein
MSDAISCTKGGVQQPGCIGLPVIRAHNNCPARCHDFLRWRARLNCQCNVLRLMDFPKQTLFCSETSWMMTMFRVIQFGGSMGFSQESLLPVDIGNFFCRQNLHLQSDQTVKASVPRLVDLAHSSCPLEERGSQTGRYEHLRQTP